MSNSAVQFSSVEAFKELDEGGKLDLGHHVPSDSFQPFCHSNTGWYSILSQDIHMHTDKPILIGWRSFELQTINTFLIDWANATLHNGFETRGHVNTLIALWSVFFVLPVCIGNGHVMAILTPRGTAYSRDAYIQSAGRPPLGALDDVSGHVATVFSV